ncbi:hypothetical protein AGMMS49959_04500 [Planctomycetales bacterium]|nr:hypothetical protein AGMMS49959_04500 [Planctomycetales bacterium]
MRGEDAEIGAMVLDLMLTTRARSPMVSFPARAFDENVKRLRDAGYLVATAERAPTAPVAAQPPIEIGGESYPVDAIAATIIHRNNAGDKRFDRSVVKWANTNYAVGEQTADDYYALVKTTRDLSSAVINTHVQAAERAAAERPAQATTAPAQADLPSIGEFMAAEQADIDAEDEAEAKLESVFVENAINRQAQTAAPAQDDLFADNREEIAAAMDIAPEKLTTAMTPAEPDVPEASNYRITDDRLGEYTPKERYENNRDEIKTLKLLESENRPATPEEQATLAKFTGWGALSEQVFGENRQGKWEREANQEMKDLLTPEEYQAAESSSLNAHYTSPTVIKAMWNKIAEMGFERGNVLEPSMGAGNFFGLAPEKIAANASFFGVELDSLTGRIAQKLYPKTNIEITGYEKTAPNSGFYDVAIGNVPFGSYKIYDPQYEKNKFLIHDYFFAKTLDQVRPNGVVAFVTSKGTMDKNDRKVRQYLMERAKLLGAIRLPSNAFAVNAGTQVTTDIIFLQKRETLAILSPKMVENPAYDQNKDAKNEDENGNEIPRYIAENAGNVKVGVKMIANPAYDKTKKAGENVDANGAKIPEFLGSEDIVERDWVNLSSITDVNGEEIPLNPYFVEHPEMILGTMSNHGKMRAGEETTCNPIPGANLADQLTGAMAHIEGDIRHIADRDADNANTETANKKPVAPEEYIPATREVKPFTHVIRNGNVYFREDSRMRKIRFVAI